MGFLHDSKRLTMGSFSRIVDFSNAAVLSAPGEEGHAEATVEELR